MPDKLKFVSIVLSDQDYKDAVAWAAERDLDLHDLLKNLLLDEIHR